MSVIPPGSTIGILGGGQLGRMTALAAASLGYNTHIYCPDPDSPASHVSRYSTQAGYDDENALSAFADHIDVLTFEFENVPASAAEFLSRRVPVRPKGYCLHISQNRIREKSLAASCGIPTAPFVEVRDLKSAIETIGVPSLLKTAELGYDGKGQIFIEDERDDIGIEFPSILEAYIPFKTEVSSIAARGPDGSMAVFPTVENIHENGILRKTYAPGRVPGSVARLAGQYASLLAEQLDLVGLLAVEYFVTEDDSLLFNEMAPRPHNSGHWTLDGCVTSQFEQLVRAICGLPLGSTRIHTPTIMENLLGDEWSQWNRQLLDPEAKFHLYGKEQALSGRKMGHVSRASQDCKVNFSSF